MPKELPNGRIIYENPSDIHMDVVPFNYILRFGCNHKYERMGSFVIVCESTYKWSDEPPSCVDVECGKPPSIANGHYEILIGETRSNPVLGSLTNYSCDVGFELTDIQDSTTLHCSFVDGGAVWVGIPPSCKEKDTCEDPGTSPNGQRSGNCCYVGESELRYSCEVGYELIGQEVILCGHGGNWTGLRPTCRPMEGSCPNPPDVPNGHVTGHKSAGDYYTIFDEVEVICDVGFAHFGESKFVMCEENFEWEIDFGECKETFCEVPDALGNGTIVEVEAMATNNVTSFPYATVITYICDVGFRLVGSSTRLCGDRGSWLGNEPFCEPVQCYDPGVPENGMRNGRDFSVAAKVLFSCFSGFTLIGSVERYCLPNGQWSGSLTRCNLDSYYCPDPGVPINGIKIGKSYNLGDRVEFKCSAKFSLIGSAIRECLFDGSWSGQETQCLGAQDFDNTIEVKELLRNTIIEKAEQQAQFSRKYYNGDLRSENGSTIVDKVQRKRILQMNSNERIVLYFLFDVSGSVGLNNFKISIDFAKALVKMIGISEDGARAGALTFSSKAEVKFLPAQYSTTKEVLDHLNNINYTRGGTATNWALQILASQMIPLTKKILGPKGIKSVVFILTDGKANTGGNPEEQAKLLKEAGVEIYCIGITGDIRKNQLYSIASTPKNSSEKYVFVLDNYNSLEWLIEEISNGTVDYSKCGLGLEKHAEMNLQRQAVRVLGGNSVSKPWPWMAALYIREFGSFVLKCGGSIIGQKYVLTAAHCVCEGDTEAPIKLSDLSIKLGITDVENNTFLQQFEVENIHIHPGYNGTYLDYDVAILNLNRPIEYNPYVHPICLPPEDIPPGSSLYQPRQNALAAGWGYDKVLKNGVSMNVKTLRNLKQVHLPIQEREICLMSFLSYRGKAEKFTERMFCAGTGDANGDTCGGDSGGPLIQSQANKLGNIYWVQIGIVSWGIESGNANCGSKNTYGYYTNVRLILPWLKSVMTSGQTNI